MQRLWSGAHAVEGRASVPRVAVVSRFSQALACDIDPYGVHTRPALCVPQGNHTGPDRLELTQAYCNAHAKSLV